MNIQLEPGRYVVAVSGGVDSMALLHKLASLNREAVDGRPPFQLTVAHFDHGIRGDSAEDRRLVQQASRSYGLPFVYDEGWLGPGASEARARTARYAFLRSVAAASQSRAIITAHHQDDALETAILNLLRGTGRRGLTSLANRPDIARPLLDIPKQHMVDYAQAQNLTWREDSTNQDEAYLRNYIRRRLLPRFDEASRERLRSIITELRGVNGELDRLLVNQLHLQSVTGTIDRQWFTQLPHAVAREIIATWLRAHHEQGFDSKTLERLVVAAKVARPGTVFPVSKINRLRVERNYLALDAAERWANNNFKDIIDNYG